MKNFLLEIFSEEIPALMQKNSAQNLAQIAKEIFLKNNLEIQDCQIKSYVTPLRLTLEIEGLEEFQKTPIIKKIGPKIDADKKAIEGFLKSVGLTNENQLEKTQNNGNICYVFVKPASEIKTAEILQNSLPQILQKMVGTWSKLMRWNVENSQTQPKWIRPIRNILCLFGEQIIAFEFAGLVSNNQTFISFLPYKIKDLQHYQQFLEQNFIILDHAKRRQKIIDQIQKISNESGFEPIDDFEKSSLFDEVAGLCESPTALLASIDEVFLELPKEVLVLTLKLNQRYFCLKNAENKLAAKFIFIANCQINSSNQEKIIKDNEKLVRARLNDAQFFIAEDLKKPLISRLEQLDKIVFHQKLGSIFDKITRLQSLAKFLAIFVPHTDLNLVKKAANLCKADLSTKAVAEMPELQGKIGSFYAQKQGENAKISTAIYEHYLPVGQSSQLPKTALGIVLSIADKIDSIVGFFLANEKPTSSKDPYALRRAALGIIRIGFEHNIAFPIRILVEKSIKAYPNKMLKSFLLKDEKSLSQNRKILVEEIIRFFVERLKSHLKETELLNAEIVNVVIDEYLSNLNAHKYCDILYLAKKIKFLDQFVKNPDNKTLILLYKRSANILAIEEKKDGKNFDSKISLLTLKNKHERVIYLTIKKVARPFKKLVIKGEFELAFKLLHVLEIPLNQFFDHVIVNDIDKNLRENRLVLLSKIRALFAQVGDLSKIEIS
jgi:glycyl-tRNA synthetase beta chain